MNHAMKHARKLVAGLVAAAALATVAACGDDSGNESSASTATTESTASSLPTGSQPAKLDPAEFTTTIDNPYWPMKPGSKWVYDEPTPRATEGGRHGHRPDQADRERDRGPVVHDVVSQNGEPVEVTDDWYAQDADGNIWYLGEDTAEYENGKVVSREGSFEAGVDGAEAGVTMPAEPPARARPTARSTCEGEAEDFARCSASPSRSRSRSGSFDNVLQTEDVNPLGDPQQVENKFYAEGVGPLLTLDLTGEGREELVSYTPGS